MTLETEFVPLELESLHREAAVMKAEGWRFIQTHAVNTDAGIDLYYSFMKDGRTLNYRVAGITPDQPVPSITDLFLAAFVFENEARELFGVDMRDIAIDFGGALYAPAEQAPMTFISPEQKAAREKAKKAAAAKAAKEAGEAHGAKDSIETAAPSANAEAKTSRFVMTSERQARLNAKMATMSYEKRAKVEAALAARATESAARSSAPAAEVKPQSEAMQSSSGAEGPDSATAAERARDTALEEKLANMDPAKAAKVRAALQAKEGKAAEAIAEPLAAPSEQTSESSAAISPVDAQLENLIAMMDGEKAAVVRLALNQKGGE